MRYAVIVKLHKDFIEVNGNTITVGVKSPPEKGKANAEAIKKIAAHFGIPRSSVKIITGASSRKKTVEIIRRAGN